MKNENKECLWKRLSKYKRALGAYAIIILLSVGLSFLFIKIGNSDFAERIKAFISFAVGISGTMASLYSIFVSAKSDLELNDERDARKEFFEKLDGTLVHISDNTDYIKKNVETVLKNNTHEDVDVCYNMQPPDDPTNPGGTPNTADTNSSSSTNTWNSKKESKETKIR